MDKSILYLTKVPYRGNISHWNTIYLWRNIVSVTVFVVDVAQSFSSGFRSGLTGLVRVESQMTGADLD